jgi:multiple sugar transport system permease protein
MNISKFFKNKFAYFLIIPSVLVIFFFLVSPIVTGIYLSLFKVSLAGSKDFVGFNNYLLLFNEPRFLENLKLTIIYLFGNLILSVPLSYIAAFVINSKLKGIGILRALYLLPWIIAPVVSVVLFRTLVDPNIGPVPYLIDLLFGKTVILLGNQVSAMIVIIIHSVWRSFPFMMLLLSTGLSAIPSEVIDASKVDGTNRWQRFRFIIFPLTRIHLLIVMLVISLWTIQDVEGIYALTQGGPGYSTEVTAIRLFKEGFLNFDLGLGSTIGIILMFMGLILLYINSIVSKKSKDITL